MGFLRNCLWMGTTFPPGPLSPLPHLLHEELSEPSTAPVCTTEDEASTASSHTVEDAVAFARRAAASAGQWALVGQLARELEARRTGGGR
jgi:hypothetical protein